jgi:hypothetical protein
MAVGHQKILPDLQLFQQHEGQNGHLQSEREGQHLVEKQDLKKQIGQGLGQIKDLKKVFRSWFVP